MKYIKSIKALIGLFVSYIYDFIQFMVHSAMFVLNTDTKRNLKDILFKHRAEKINTLFEEPFNKGYMRNLKHASIRTFEPTILPESVYCDIADKARLSPSACNRQPIKIYRVKEIEKAMNLHRGLKEPVYNLIAIVGDVNYYNAIGERYQVYVDGGIFLMNTLNAIRGMGYGACPLHWCVDYQKDRKIRKLIKIKKSERIIAFVTFGKIHPDAKTCPSVRKRAEEILVL